MIKIGFLGCGKIGRALLEEAREIEDVQIGFVQDLFFPEEGAGFPVLRRAEEEIYAACDLVIECATADVLKENVELILKHCDLMTFSVTAFSDIAFENQVRELIREYKRRVYIPHGAILGLDGIFDGRRVWEQVSIETVKNPASLGRTDTARTVLFEGPAREGCRLYPRNVNVHAAVALAGIGFDKTISRILADPDVHTNSHVISLKGEGVNMQIHVESFSSGGVTGKYTPYSACGSLRRLLDKKAGLLFI